VADLQQKISDTEDNDEENRLKAEEDQLEQILTRLKSERTVLRSRIAQDQAASNSNALESAIQAQRELATKDWKAEHDKMMAKNRELEGELEKLRAANDYPGGLEKPIRAVRAYRGNSVEWMSYSVGEVLYTSGHRYLPGSK